MKNEPNPPEQKLTRPMNKPKKTFTIIDAIHNKDVFGGLPAFSSLATWVGWLAWLKSVFALPMDESEQAIYRQCTGKTQTPTKVSSLTEVQKKTMRTFKNHSCSGGFPSSIHFLAKNNASLSAWYSVGNERLILGVDTLPVFTSIIVTRGFH